MRAQPKHEPASAPLGTGRADAFLPLDVPEAEVTGNPVHRYQNDLASRLGEVPSPAAARGRFAPSAIVTVPLAAAGTVVLVPVAIAVAVVGRIARRGRGGTGGDVAAAIGGLSLAFRAAAAALSTR